MYMLNCYIYFFSDQNQSFESTAENYISLSLLLFEHLQYSKVDKNFP